MEQHIENLENLADQLLYLSLCVRRKSKQDFVSTTDIKDHKQRIKNDVGIASRHEELLKGYNVVENLVDQIYFEIEQLRKQK
jgi:hypothetical protein